jgi:hypothetical protein
MSRSTQLSNHAAGQRSVAVGQIIESSTEAPDTVMRAEVAHYVGEMSAELSRMAKASGLSLLSYFLEMASAEARSEAERANLPPQTRE